MPHLAVVAFDVIWIILALIFVRFRFEKRFAREVSLAIDVLIVFLIVALIFISFRFSSL